MSKLENQIGLRQVQLYQNDNDLRQHREKERQEEMVLKMINLLLKQRHEGKYHLLNL
ncbi:hypothetical protein BDC45DRAFT_516871 [Circinella umbellata]|nr:hypothetical protein BDC45DRAFT_516871 [Circinella umbellata]